MMVYLMHEQNATPQLRFMRLREVERASGLSRSTIHELIRRRELPKPIKLTSKGKASFWQATASAGIDPGIYKLRSWHGLSRSVTGEQLKVWLQPAIKRGLVH